MIKLPSGGELPHPFFVEQVLAGMPITITDPEMTRFMMTLADAVELVLYAFEHGNNGDIFVQQAPAATMETLLKAIFKLKQCEDYPVQDIGIRHGEKVFEVLKINNCSGIDLGLRFHLRNVNNGRCMLYDRK